MLNLSSSIPFVGRVTELNKIQSLVSRRGETHLILLQGKGGIGKTRLLHEVQSRCPTWAEDVRVVFLDLQNIASRSVEFLVDALANQLGHSYFQRSLQIAFPHSSKGQVPDTLVYEDLGQILVQELNEFTDKFRLVFIIDTFELMGRTRLAKFLLDNLPACQDILFLFAGREVSQEDSNRIQTAFRRSAKVKVIKLHGFTLKDTTDLFKKLVSSTYLKRGIPKKVHLLSGGRPILVLLAIDWLKPGRNLPNLGNRSLYDINLDELKKAVRSTASRQEVNIFRDLQEEFESKLVSKVQDLQERGFVILHMALAHLRCNATILSVLMQDGQQPLDEDAKKKNLEKARELINEVRATSFVKIWSEEPNLACALHDEMRRLVLEYVWQSVDATHEQRRKLIQYLIQEYYNKKINELQNKKRDLVSNRSFEPKSEEFHTLTAEIDLLEVERLRYLLEYIPKTGREQFDDLYNDAMRSRNFLRCEFLLDEMERAGHSQELESYRTRLLVQSSQDVDITRIEELLTQKAITFEERINILQILAQKNPPRNRLRLYQQALELAGNLNDSKLLGKILNNLGLTYRIRGEWDRAIECYQLALEKCRAINDEVQLAATLNNLAYVLILKGNFEQADRLSRLALALRERLSGENERDIAFSYLTLGALYREQGDLRQALIRFGQAVDVFARLDDVNGQLQAYTELADMDVRLGNYQQAEKLQIIQTLLERVPKNKPLQAEASLTIGRVRRMQFSANRELKSEITEDLAGMALENFERARALASEIGDDYLSARANYELAYLAYLGGVVHNINIYIEEALAKVKGRFTRLEGYLEELQGHQEFLAEQYESAAAHYANACNRMASFNRQQYQSTFDRVAQRLLSLLPGMAAPLEQVSAFRVFCQSMLKVLLSDKEELSPLIQLIQLSLEVTDRKKRTIPHLWAGVPAIPSSPTNVFIDREEQLRELDASLSDARNGKLRVTFINGEAGFGKTYLVEFFLNGLQNSIVLPPIAIHRSRCSSNTHQSVLAPYRTLVYDLVDNYLTFTRDVNNTEDRVIQFWQFLKDFAPSWTDILSTTRREADSPTGGLRITDENIQQRIIFSQFMEIVRQVARFRPVILWIDDIHLADSSSLELIKYLAVRENYDLPLFLICTFQTSEQLQSTLQALGKHLTELRDLDVDSYVRRRYLHLSFPDGYEFPQFVRFVEETTGGFPLHLAQLFDWWEEIGAIVKEGETWRLTRRVDQITYIPTEIATILQSRLERVEKDNLMPLLEVTAVLGEPFLAQVAECMLNEESWTTESVQNGLTRLSENYRFIIRDESLAPKSQTLYRFAYPLIHTEIYERMKRANPERVQALHTRAGICLENELNRIMAEAQIDVHTSWFADEKIQLIRHFREAGLHEKTLSTLLTEARHCEFSEAKNYYQQAIREAAFLYPEILSGLEQAVANYNRAVTPDNHLLYFNIIGDWLSMLLIGTEIDLPSALMKSMDVPVRSVLASSDNEVVTKIIQRINDLLLMFTPLVISESLTMEQRARKFELIRLLGEWCLIYYQRKKSLQNEADCWAYLTWVANRAQLDYTELAQETAERYNTLGDQMMVAGDLDSVLYCWDRAAWHYRAIEQYATSASLYLRLADLIGSNRTVSYLRLGFLASAVAVSWREFEQRKQLSHPLPTDEARKIALLIKSVADEMVHELAASQIAGLLYEYSLELLRPSEGELIDKINSGKSESDRRLKRARGEISEIQAAVVGLAIGEDVVSDRVASHLIEQGINTIFTWPAKKEEFQSLENTCDLVVLVGGPRAPAPVGPFVLDIFADEPHLYELYDTQRSQSHIWHRRVNSTTYLLIAGSNFIATMNAVNEFVTDEQWREWLRNVIRS